MAKKISDNDKALLVADHKTGKFSQRALSKKYDVSIGTVNKLTKEEEKTNEHLVNAQVAILSAKEELPSEQMNAVMNTAQDELRRKNLVFGASEKIVQATSDMLTKGKKQVVVKVKEYSKESGSSESLDVIDQELDPQDLKNLSDTVDKASLTLGVNQRHAPKVQVDTGDKETNNYLTVEEVSRAVADGLPD